MAVHLRCLLLALAFVLLPEVAAACPVCFQAAESSLLDSARLGVAVMLVVVIAVLGAFARWFVRLARLEAAAASRVEGEP